MKIMHYKQQQGFVSIIVVITLSILISLITIAFVRVMTSGQRQTLDSQLSTQAYYAAETGINDALKAIATNPTEIKTDDKDCAATPFTAGGSVPNQVLTSGETTVSYSCQLITSGTKDILMSAGDGVSKTFPIYTDTAANSVSIEWEDNATNQGFETGPADNFKAATAWPSSPDPAPAMMRITIYQPGGGNVSSAAIIANQRNFFVKPGVAATNDGIVSYGSADGTAKLANCAKVSATRPYACRLTITGLSGTAIKNGVFIKVQPIYKNANYRITAAQSNSYDTANALPLFGAQYRVDVTGKANDVYRRLEVRLPLAGFTSPDSGVDSGSICKNFEWNGSGLVGANPCGY
jgi:Tfp pilus assembly protein PilX